MNSFTITRSTLNGVQEVLTVKGFRNRLVAEEQGLQLQWFNREEGSKRVRELRANCRIPKIRKSIILNYS